MTDRLHLETDLDHGGRWTSLRARGREWLWVNPDPAMLPARRRVVPGDAFVDAGGGEECFPTIRGAPDHGDVWTRPWSGTAEDAEVTAGAFTLRRLVRTHDDGLEVGYRVRGPVGGRFVHAAHLLLQLSPEARLMVPEAETMTVLDVPDPVRPWPSGLDRLGPDDGTAVCALLPDCHQVSVIDGAQVLSLSWTSGDRPAPCSLLVWRNLGGWPAEHPYRSIGVEPMVGRSADLAAAGPEDAVELPTSGEFAWTLRLRADAVRPAPNATAGRPG